ncbi:cache domain-containing protein [Mangrovibacterium marinum]|uniref:histidine kinase n=1 Tax=Mangrovibacterium marinum TaxID=1639118 RepID=A0A2T5BZA8_9BACT|nr:cache domain-containing protein [Mangrovibacterium marinum]PTN07603.1 signal transduction histidine kinase [Mangrovibacterium marinum]
MFKRNSPPGIPEYIRRVVVLTTVLITISVTVLVIAQQLVLYKNTSEQLRHGMIEKQKQFVKDLIAIEVEYIENQKRAFDNEVAQKLVDHVQTARQLAEDLYNRYHADMNQPELEKLIIQAVSSLRGFSPYTHIFINTLDGKGVYYSGKPGFAGKNLVELTDSYGNKVVQAEIDKIHQAEGGIIYYGDASSGGSGQGDKLSYVEPFDALGWYFGAKCYISDYDEEFQDEIARKVSSERFRYGGYLFLTDSDAYPIVLEGSVYREDSETGRAINEAQQNVFLNQLKVAKSSDEGGFIHYDWNGFTEQTKGRKIAYVRYYKPAGWMLGAGFYIDELESELRLQNMELKSGVVRNIVQVVLLVLLVVLAELYLLYRFRLHFKQDFDMFKHFFQRGKGSYEMISVEKIHFREFAEMGVVANEMIEERRRIHNQLVAEQEKARASDRLKTAFLANMSHEIRTPMNAIIGFGELVDDEELDPEMQKTFIRLIRQNGQMLMCLIDDIIDIAKIESGQMSVTKAWFRLNDLMAELEAHFCGLVENDPDKSIAFGVNLDIPSEYPCFSDAFRLKQVLYNLIGNAIKFTQHGKVGVHVVLRNECLYFTVTDSGIGIAKDELDVIFERFMQSANHRDKNFGGTGLGLAICKNIVGLLGGEITVKSVLGEGSTFGFYIPVESREQNP